MNLTYLSRADVESVQLPMHEIIHQIERLFQIKDSTEMPPKPGIHPGPPDSFIHAMPASIPAFQSAGIKWVSGFPSNAERNLPYIHGLIILNDPETGIPTAVMDATWITAQRTAAASAVAAKYLALPQSRSIGFLACGVQAISHLEAFTSLFPIQEVKAFDLFPEKSAHFSQNMSKKFNLPIQVVHSPREAVEGMDLVITSGPILKSPQPVIESHWLKPGVFASAVDFDSYFTPEALAKMDHITTDDFDQFRYYQKAGYFQKSPRPHSELSELVLGKTSGRRATGERTLAMNLGIALEDMAIAPLILKRAKEMNLGRQLPL